MQPADGVGCLFLSADCGLFGEGGRACVAVPLWGTQLAALHKQGGCGSPCAPHAGFSSPHVVAWPGLVSLTVACLHAGANMFTCFLSRGQNVPFTHNRRRTPQQGGVRVMNQSALRVAKHTLPGTAAAGCVSGRTCLHAAGFQGATVPLRNWPPCSRAGRLRCVIVVGAASRAARPPRKGEAGAPCGITAVLLRVEAAIRQGGKGPQCSWQGAGSSAVVALRLRWNPCVLPPTKQQPVRCAAPSSGSATGKEPRAAHSRRVWQSVVHVEVYARMRALETLRNKIRVCSTHYCLRLPGSALSSTAATFFVFFWGGWGETHAHNQSVASLGGVKLWLRGAQQRLPIA